MDDDINLSLDDIIRKRKVRNRKEAPGNGPAPRATYTGGPRAYRNPNTMNLVYYPRTVEDARAKIIKNKRAKMRDARDQLNVYNRGRDARFRLLNRKTDHEQALPLAPLLHVLDAVTTNGRNNIGTKHFKPKLSNRRYTPMEYVPQSMISQPTMPLYRPTPTGISFRNDAVEENPFARMDLQRITTNQSIGSLATATRTLHNDAYARPSTMPPLPHFPTVRSAGTLLNANNGASLMNFSPHPVNPEPDPFDQYEVNRRPNMSVPPPPLPPNRPLRSILRTRPTTPPLAPQTVTSGGVPLNLSPSMRARLERAPNPNKSMGIFAHNDRGEPPVKNFFTRSPSPPAAPPTTVGYRIVVSNLHPSVTQIDIKELFEDIGDLLESRLVRPGVAEVIYRNLKDAEKAVDAYHNRQLDGQPMNCLLVNPRATYKINPTNVKYDR